MLGFDGPEVPSHRQTFVSAISLLLFYRSLELLLIVHVKSVCQKRDFLKSSWKNPFAQVSGYFETETPPGTW